MKSYVKAIIIFNENGEKRNFPDKQGVNYNKCGTKNRKTALGGING